VTWREEKGDLKLELETSNLKLESEVESGKWKVKSGK
jgi:hypothetical protein